MLIKIEMLIIYELLLASFPDEIRFLSNMGSLII